MFSVNIKDHVKENQKVKFKFYKMGKLFYETELGLIFEIPLTDTGNASFMNEAKALNFMRWIRPALEKLKMKES